MGLLHELSTKYKTLSIVGMAKNAGKTTALNYLIEEAIDEGIVLGITSTGRDGETQDLVTGTEKPRVFLEEDMLVAVPALLYDMADAGLEVIQRTRYSTAIGPLFICRVKEAGYVQIAGPVINAEQKLLCRDMLELGCQLVLIDGAIDRKTIASPDTSDAIILSTGAVLSRKMNKVVEETAHIVNLYRLPQLEEGTARNAIEKNIFEDKVMLVNDKGEVKKLDLLTGLGAAREINGAIDEDTRYIYIPGAFTNSVISDISLKNLKQVQIVLKDPTKIFINVMDWGIFRKKGLRVKVLKNIEIAAITVNPWAPAGYTFDNRFLLETMKEAIPDIPIIDVRM
ncbi:MAG: hypothetical protein SO251_08500 [Candidatus Fimisoma sp.]|nr:hypothetical protein [Bacillota bacterium]MDY4748797.1 hypothetical protein [Candidatus Fimisoma sp.]